MARAVLRCSAHEAAARERPPGTPEILDRIDAWVEDGVLNGERLRGPDFAVASRASALVDYILELQPDLQGAGPARRCSSRSSSRSDAARWSSVLAAVLPSPASTREPRAYGVGAAAGARARSSVTGPPRRRGPSGC